MKARYLIPFLFIGSALGQISAPVTPINVITAPSGACAPGAPPQQVVSTGTIYTCQSGTWGAISGGATLPYSGIVYGTSAAGGTVATGAQVASAISGQAIAPSTVTPSGSVGTNAEYSNGTCTTAATIAAANGNHQKVTLTNADACALTFTQPSSGTITITLKIIQSAAGSFNGTITGCKWPGGVVPTITATSGAVDFISAYLDGTNAYCVASQNFR